MGSGHRGTEQVPLHTEEGELGSNKQKHVECWTDGVARQENANYTQGTISK